MLTALIIANIILTVLTITFVVKNLLINFIQSKSKIKNLCTVILPIAILILSLAASMESYWMIDHRNMLEKELLTVNETLVTGEPQRGKKEIEEELKTLKRTENYSIAYTVICCLSYGSLLVIHKNISKEINEVKSDGTWDLNKY